MSMPSIAPKHISRILIFQMPVPANDPFERDLLRDRAYTTIRDAIVDGTLAPGERLRDQELTEWLALRRTPGREAPPRPGQGAPAPARAGGAGAARPAALPPRPPARPARGRRRLPGRRRDPRA